MSGSEHVHVEDTVKT